MECNREVIMWIAFIFFFFFFCISIFSVSHQLKDLKLEDAAIIESNVQQNCIEFEKLFNETVVYDTDFHEGYRSISFWCEYNKTKEVVRASIITMERSYVR